MVYPDDRKVSAAHIAIVPMTAEMVPEVGKLHVEAFAPHLSTRIGTGYVNALLKWFLQAEQAIALVATDNHGKVLGYVVGAPRGCGKPLFRDLLWVAAAGVIVRPWLFFNQHLWSSLAIRLRLLVSASQPPEATPDLPEPTMLLVGLGVSLSARGKKIGLHLLETFQARAYGLGMRSLQLSVYPENTAARRLYESCGWRPFPGPVRNKDAMRYFRVFAAKA